MNAELESSSTAVRKRRLWLRTLYLSIAGVLVSPCFGLFGTVVGMMRAFGTLAETGEAEPVELADDISVALLTTMWGLIFTAIFLILLVVSIFRFLKWNRKLKQLGSEGEEQATLSKVNHAEE